MAHTVWPNAQTPDTCQRMAPANHATITAKLAAPAKKTRSAMEAATTARKLSSPNKALLATALEIMKRARMATTTNGLATSKILETKSIWSVENATLDA